MNRVQIPQSVRRMVEAVIFRNDPTNKSRWAFELDPESRQFAEMIDLAADAMSAEDPALTRVLGGIPPIDPAFIERMSRLGGVDHMDAIAGHGFTRDWNNERIDEWPTKLDEIEAVTDRPAGVSEVGVSTFGADEVQGFGIDLDQAVERLREPGVRHFRTGLSLANSIRPNAEAWSIGKCPHWRNSK